MPPNPRFKALPRVLSSAPLSRRPPPLLLGIGPTTTSRPCRLQLLSSPAASNNIRTFSSSSKEKEEEEPLPLPPGRWYSDFQARLGKCILFGCSREQARRAAGVLRALATEWRALAAGAEGFLTGGRRGLEGQQVVWGEMDSFVGGYFYRSRPVLVPLRRTEGER